MFLLVAMARGADSPPAPAQLTPINTTMEAHAPSVMVTEAEYKQMQAIAPEVVTIHVALVKTQTAETEDKNPGAVLVEARAVVTGVVKSDTKLEAGSVIYLQYGYIPPTAEKPASPPTPIIKENTDYRAYLGGGLHNAPYVPVAGAQSFADLSAGDAATGEPLADPAKLPTPDNPSPEGSVRVRGKALEQFAKVVETDGKWGVSVAGGDPLPLQVVGGAKPVLLVYYGPHGKPVTQPTVIIYQAGTQPAMPPNKGDVTVERALILDGDKHWLGDALWALRVGNNMRPIPLPQWHWNTYKVDITDDDKHITQTIMLTGAPMPVVAPPAPSVSTGTGAK